MNTQHSGTGRNGDACCQRIMLNARIVIFTLVSMVLFAGSAFSQQGHTHWYSSSDATHGGEAESRIDEVYVYLYDDKPERNGVMIRTRHLTSYMGGTGSQGWCGYLFLPANHPMFNATLSIALSARALQSDVYFEHGPAGSGWANHICRLTFLKILSPDHVLPE